MRQSATGGIPLASLTRLATRELPHVVSGLAVEAVWATTHMVMYPLGLLSAPTHATSGHRRHNLHGLSPEQRGLIHYDVAAAATPILLVHGFIENHAIFSVMERALRRRGFQMLTAYDYGLLTHSIPRAAIRLGETIERLVTQSGYERINVIGHSLGGLITRYYVQRLGGDSWVHTLVTLGTPHQGTHLARAAPLLPLVRQLTPSSPIIQELAEPAPGCRTRFIAFHSDIDPVIVPSGNARLEHPDLNVQNISVRGVGHLSLPRNGRIAFTIAEALRQLDDRAASRINA
ncbi:MAG TPA: alpha/beta fold hydrolase [Propionibacteriaceae bacterium]|nr:alpha/beta fold hydrolase [Propionibacteriaceae bacterium]